MKKCYYLFFLVFCLPMILQAQQRELPCDAYDRLIQEAKQALSNQDNLNPEFVFRKLRTARIKSRDCGASNPTRNFFPEIDDTFDLLFRVLKQQSAELRNAKETAASIDAELRAQQALLQQERQKIDGLSASVATQGAQLEQLNEIIATTETDLAASREKTAAAITRAQRILSKIYFHNGQYGLATDGENYGFINKELETLIPFEYEEALPFDDSGFARVRKKNRAYLIDTQGEEYRLAEDLSQYRFGAVALDLRRLLSRQKSGLKMPFSKSDKHLTIKSKLPPLAIRFKDIQILLANNGRLDDIKNLEYIRKLREVQLSQNRIKNIKPLSKHKKLAHIRLDRNEVEDISALAKLEELRTLHLQDNNIRDISSLSGLKQLEWLHLGENRMKSYSTAIDLPNLRYLNLDDNRLINIEGVHALKGLVELSVQGNLIRNLDTIARLTKLEKLNVNDNKISSLVPIAEMEWLKELHISENYLKDLKPIANLKALEVLDISKNCNIKSFKPLYGLSNLRSLKISVCKGELLEDINELKTKLPDCSIIIE